MKQLKYTWFEWNFAIAVNINSSFSNVLNPVLDLTNSGIDTNAGTLNTIANHTNLGKSKLITVLHKIRIVLSVLIRVLTFHFPVSSKGLQSLPGKSPCHWHRLQHKCGNLKIINHKSNCEYWYQYSLFYFFTIDVFTLFIWDNLDFHFLKFGGGRTFRCHPPTNHCCQPIRIKFVHWGWEANWGCQRGKCDWEDQEYREIIVPIFIIKFRMIYNVVDINSVHHVIVICCIMLPHQHLDWGGDLVEGAVGSSKNVLTWYDGTSTKRLLLLIQHYANLIMDN